MQINIGNANLKKECKLITVEHTHMLNRTFLYLTVSTLKPTVGIVVTDWPNLSLYNIAVYVMN